MSTNYLAETLEKLAKEEAEILALAETDKGLGDLATEELKNIRTQKKRLKNKLPKLLLLKKLRKNFPTK